MNTRLLPYFIAVGVAIVVIVMLSPIVSAVSTYFTRVAGIPINPDVETSTITAAPNEKIVSVNQPGRAVFTVVRAKVVGIDSILNDEGKIAGFRVAIDVKLPRGAIVDLKVAVCAETYDGSIIEGSNTITVNATGTYMIDVMLANPIDSDDLAYLSVDVTPT